MAKIRRVLRKVPAHSQLVVDEQFWPVMLATFVLGGFLMGTVAAYLPFGARSWWQDARSWLFIIPVLTCAAVWALRRLPSRVVRRALQISVVLGLVIHVLLLVLSLESRIFGRFMEPIAKNSPRRPPRELRVVNEYQPYQLNEHQRRQQEYMQPVETTLPDPEPEMVEPQEQPEEPRVNPPPMPEPQTPREIQRNPIERPTPAETKPRESEQTSRLSRQVAEARPMTSEAIQVPRTAAPTAQSSTLEARSDRLPQRAPAPTAAASQAKPQPATPSSEIAPRIARRDAEQAPEMNARTGPALPRRVNQPSSLAQSDLRSGEVPSTARQTDTAAVEPARTTVSQQPTTASPVTAAAVEPVAIIPPTTPAENPSPQREQPSPVQPRLAETPVPVPNRQPRATARSEPTSAAPTIASASRPVADPAASLQAASSTIARTATTIRPSANPNTPPISTQPTASPSTRRPAPQAPSTAVAATSSLPRAANGSRSNRPSTAVATPAPSATSEPAAETSLAGGGGGLQQRMSVLSAAGATAGAAAPTVASSPPSVAVVGQRAEASTGADAPPMTSTVNPVNRTPRRSELATSTTLVETPRTVTADAGGDEPQARPSRVAMTRSLEGVAGVGQTANLDRSQSVPGSPATTASGAAQRAEATQSTPAGPALAPSATAIARRSLVGADRPSASVRASTDAVSPTTGSDQPAESNATAAASLVRQDANAARGEVTASKGNIDLDLGPTRVADAGGFERASGGGQPQVDLTSESQTLSRSRAGGQAPLAAATNVIDIAATTPASNPSAVSDELSASKTPGKQAQTAGVGSRPAEQTPPSAEVGGSSIPTDQVAATPGSRAGASPDIPAVGEAAGDSPAADDEEERRRRLERAMSRSGPAGSLAGPVVPTDMGTAEAPAEELASRTSVAPSGDVERQPVASEIGGGEMAMTESSAGAPADGGGDLVGEPTMQRAEAADAISGTAVPGGGTNSHQRTATRRELATNATAEIPTMAGAPASSGLPKGLEAMAQGGQPARTVTGAVSRSSANPVGAAADELPRDAPAQGGSSVVAGIAPRTSAPGDTPAIVEATPSGAAIPRASRTPALSSPLNAVTAGVPTTPSSTATADADLPDPSLGAGATAAKQQSAAAVPIEVAAVEGPGGLGDLAALEVGIQSRFATPESIEVQTAPSRFVRQNVGGAPELNTAAVFAADAFRNRTPSKSGIPAGPPSGPAGPQTEESIELGLAYLAKRQLSDGSWTLRSTGESVQLASDTAATGLCLLSFQGAGYSHREHKYAAQIAAGIDYLVKNQKPDGDLFVPLDDVSNRSVWLYSHGIAAIALCEAYGMTHDPKLREPAQKALDFIIATQDPKGGGWRYQPGVESDTSVTGWMMMALKSGELAGLKTPRPTYDHIARWLDTAQGSSDERHLYRYNPYAPDTETQRHGRSPTPTMTAVGLLMRLYGGWKRDHPTMVAGAEYLRENLPAVGTVREPLRDTYYWYYGTQVMFHMGGDFWKQWNGELHPLLIESQVKQGELAGSWSPRSPVPDRWAPHAGRLYVTTMNLLSLEVTYRHLPLYVDTAK